MCYTFPRSTSFHAKKASPRTCSRQSFRSYPVLKLMCLNQIATSSSYLEFGLLSGLVYHLLLDLVSKLLPKFLCNLICRQQVPL